MADISLRCCHLLFAQPQRWQSLWCGSRHHANVIPRLIDLAYTMPFHTSAFTCYVICYRVVHDFTGPVFRHENLFTRQTRLFTCFRHAETG